MVARSLQSRLMLAAANVCPRCGHQNAGHLAYCSQCGRRLRSHVGAAEPRRRDGAGTPGSKAAGRWGNATPAPESGAGLAATLAVPNAATTEPSAARRSRAGRALGAMAYVVKHWRRRFHAESQRRRLRDERDGIEHMLRAAWIESRQHARKGAPERAGAGATLGASSRGRAAPGAGTRRPDQRRVAAGQRGSASGKGRSARDEGMGEVPGGIDRRGGRAARESREPHWATRAT